MGPVFNGFTDLHKGSRIADTKTIWALCERLSQAGAAEVMFSTLDSQLYEAGYESRGGPMVAATIVPTSIQGNTKEEHTRIKQGKSYVS
mgnify:CR=1 FL=1